MISFDLNQCYNLSDVADILAVEPKNLSYILYKLPENKKYLSYSILKKTGGHRRIDEPQKGLKILQKRLAIILNDYLEKIEKDRFQKTKPLHPRICSHGFRRKLIFPKNEITLGIYSNAVLHRNKRFVFNIDLENFFPSFNFGRVRGYFIKNKYFNLNEKVAKIIAQIACYNNYLPQGSPSSPVISNLISQSLDARLATLATRNGCVYSRYADDITFSTNKKNFPENIAKQTLIDDGTYQWIPSESLVKKIHTSGFKINEKKVFMQYRQSRQLVTGLVVNEKINVRKEYYRDARSMCNSLFHKGCYHIQNIKYGNDSLKKLDGILNHICSTNTYSKNRKLKYKKNEKEFTSKQKLYSKFLFYKYFIGNLCSTIVCEGITDYTYLRCAESQFKQENINNNLARYYLKYSNKNITLQIIDSSGFKSLKTFISTFSKKSFFSTLPSRNPVIVLIDNGAVEAKELFAVLRNIKENSTIEGLVSPHSERREYDRKINFWYYVTKNLYVALTPLKENSEKSEIEDFFEEDFLRNMLGGKVLKSGYDKDFCKTRHYAKNDLAEYIKKNKKGINFSKFADIFEVFNEIENDYKHKIASLL